MKSSIFTHNHLNRGILFLKLHIHFIGLHLWIIKIFVKNTARILQIVAIYVTLCNMDAETEQILTSGSIKTADIVSQLLSNGITAVTSEELSILLGVPKNQTRQRLAPLVKRHEIISPCRGFWVPIPYEYRQWGAPEAIYYVDKMMRYLNIEYYVGWMSAAAILGATHHASQVFQVATSRHFRNKVVGRSNFKFFQRSNVGVLPTFRHITQTGTVSVSTRAATMLSVTNDLTNASGLDNAANIVIELSDTDGSIIADIAACAGFFPISALRRLGWILERFTDMSDLEQLKEISHNSGIRLSKLSMYNSYSDRIDKTWSLDINERIDPDI